MNGAAPPKTIELDHPLAEKIESLDPETLQDPTEKYVFTYLKASLNLQKTESNLRGMLDQNALASMLVPGIMEKHSVETASALFELMPHYSVLSTEGQRTVGADVLASSLVAAGNIIAKSEVEGRVDSYESLRLIDLALKTTEHFVGDPSDERNPHIPEVKDIAGDLAKLATIILSSQHGLKDEGVRVFQSLIEGAKNHPYPNRRTFNSMIGLAEDPEALKIIEGDGGAPGLSQEFMDIAYQRACYDEDKFYSRFIEAGKAFASPKFTELLSRFNRENPLWFDFEYIIKNGKTNLTEKLTGIYDAFENPVVDDLVTRLTETGGTQLKESLIGVLLSEPEKFSLIMSTLSSDNRLKRMVESPSVALTSFISKLIYSSDIELLAAAGSGFIAENYAQASKQTDPVLINHFSGRIEIFSRSIESVLIVPEVADRYKQFLAESGPMSPKQELRALTVFKSLAVLNVPETPGSTVEEIEANLLNAFMTKLSGEQTTITEEQRARLLESLGTVTPLLTYCSSFMDNDQYRNALSGIVESLADGTYDSWRRGDGSSEDLQKMIEAGYMPSNLTTEQYQEWINDTSTSSSEQLISSAEDTAEAIRHSVALGSVDIDILAPGYEISLEALSSVLKDRNVTGKLLGLINKTKAETSLTADQVEEIAGSLGEDSNSPGVKEILGLLGGGGNVEEGKKLINDMRSRLDQLGLLIRIANITAEEVVAGALLTDPDENGNRKIQQKLVDALEQLTEKLPSDLTFIPQGVMDLLNDHASEGEGIQLFTVEDTIDPKVTIEIGETPSRSCQHYETGGYKGGLIGYFDPEVKIFIVRNEKGGIIARSIVRLMEDESGDPIMYAEPVYSSVASPQVNSMMIDHIAKKAASMGVEVGGHLSQESRKSRKLKVRALRMPATYSDSAGGINTGGLEVSA